MSPQPPPLKIVIVEDNPVLLDLLTGMLAGIPGLALAGHADSEATALDLLRDARPSSPSSTLSCAPAAASARAGAPRAAGRLRRAGRGGVRTTPTRLVRSRCLNLGAVAF